MMECALSLRAADETDADAIARLAESHPFYRDLGFAVVKTQVAYRKQL